MIPCTIKPFIHRNSRKANRIKLSHKNFSGVCGWSWSWLMTILICVFSVQCSISCVLVSAGGHVSAESMKNKRRVVTLITVVTLMFSISWLPIQLILLLKSVRMYKVTILNISIQVKYTLLLLLMGHKIFLVKYLRMECWAITQKSRPGEFLVKPLINNKIKWR